MPSSPQRARILRLREQQGEECWDRLAVEAPLEITLRYPSRRTGLAVDFPLSVTMRTPGEDADLVRGLLFTEGLIEHAADITAIEQPAADRVRVSLSSAPAIDPRARQRTFLSASSCGLCGKQTLEDLLPRAAPDLSPTAPLLPGAVLHALPEQLRIAQESFAATGGMHGVARFTIDGECRGAAEDVGRHNALDKLIGRALGAGQLPAQSEVLLLSGRVSYELIQKALMAGFPIVAAIGAPSSLAVSMANAARQTLIGFLRRDRYNIYSHPQRVV